MDSQDKKLLAKTADHFEARFDQMAEHFDEMARRLDIIDDSVDNCLSRCGDISDLRDDLDEVRQLLKQVLTLKLAGEPPKPPKHKIKSPWAKKKPPKKPT